MPINAFVRQAHAPAHDCVTLTTTIYLSLLKRDGPATRRFCRRVA